MICPSVTRADAILGCGGGRPLLLIHKRFGVVAGFLILLVLLAINTVAQRHQLAVQVRNQQWLSDSLRVVQELGRIDSLLKDAETGQRVIAYNGKLDYLAPSYSAIAQIDSHLQNLAALIDEDSRGRTRVADLQVLMRQEFAELARASSLLQAGDTAAAKAVVMSDKGPNIMKKMHSLVGEMEQEETSVAELRRKAYQQSIRITAASIYGGSVIAALGILFVALSIIHEIGRRERDAAALRQSEEWFRVTLSSIGDGVIATNDQGLISFLNPVAERLTGTSLAHDRGRRIGDIFHILSEHTNKPVENPVEKVLARGCAVGPENRTVLRRPNGQFLPIEDSAAPITDDSSKLIGVVLVFRDASPERSFQEALRRTEKLAAAARLSATVAHEINNPLEAIGNLIYLARTNLDAPDMAAEQLQLAEQELARISHITQQTLGFFRESISPSSVYLPSLIKSVLKLYSNKLQMKQIKIEAAIEECPPITVFAGEIQQLVSNIISNAIDALPINGTLKIEAAPMKMANGESIRLKIEDNGSGIAPENLKRIFEPFFTTKKDVGTGLGLWVCKEIAERHGGSVYAHSVTDNGSKGAVFTVLLPYQIQNNNNHA